MQLAGKAVAITGEAQGLGSSMANAFGSNGARIALIDINADRLGKAIDECHQLGIEARGYSSGISDEVSVVNLFEDVVRDFCGLVA